MKNLMQEMIL